MSKILLAEDDYNMLSLLKTLLTMEGFQVVTSWDQNGDFLDIVRRERPDLILMDIHLGDQNGLDLVKTLRATPDLRDIRVILCSGINMEIESQTVEANDFIMKPYMVDELLRKIRTQLDSK